MIKRYNQFVETKTNEEFVFGNEPAKPEVTPDVKPGTTQPLPGEPDSPSPIRRERTSPVPAPAKAQYEEEEEGEEEEEEEEEDEAEGEEEEAEEEGKVSAPATEKRTTTYSIVMLFVVLFMYLILQKEFKSIYFDFAFIILINLLNTSKAFEILNDE